MGNLEVGLFKDPIRIRNGENTVEREGEDGTVRVFMPFHSCYHFGEVLEGHWKKFNTSFPSDPFVVKLDGSGAVDFSGDSDVGGTYRTGWITSDARLFMYPGTILDVHLSHDALSSTSEVRLRLVLHDRRDDATPTSPLSQSNYLDILIYATTTAYTARIQKAIEGTASDVYAATAMTNGEGTFRMKILRDGQVEFYLHDGSGDVSEEDDQIVTKTDLDLNFDIAYVSYVYSTGDTTNKTTSSEKVTVSYPDHIPVRFYRATSDINAGEMGAREYDGSAWSRIFHKSHVPTANINRANENGLLWTIIQEGVGVQPYYWDGAAFVFPFNNLYVQLVDDAQALKYAYLRYFKKVSRTEIVAVIRLCEDAVDDEDYYADKRVGGIINFVY
jgi:hypothetical protein